MKQYLKLSFTTYKISDLEMEQQLNVKVDKESCNETLLVDLNDIHYFRFSEEETIIGFREPHILSGDNLEIVVNNTRDEILNKLSSIEDVIIL